MTSLMRLQILLFLTLSIGFWEPVWGQEIKEMESLAQQYYNMGEFEKAETYFAEVYKKTHGTNIYNQLLACYTQLDRHDEAIKLANKHFKKVNQGSILVDLAEAYRRNGSVDEYEKYIAKSVEMAAERPEQIYVIASALSRAGRNREALTCYQNARRENPNRNFGFQVAQIYGELGEVQGMFQEYLTLLETQPNYLSSVRNMLGRSISDDAFSENNQILKAELIRAIKSSDQPVFSELLIWLFLQEKNYAQALRQTIAFDKRYNENQNRVYQLAETALNNAAFEAVQEAVNYIVEVPASPFYMDAKILELRSLQLQMEARFYRDETAIQALVAAYEGLFEEFGKQPATLSLMLDYAHLLAFRAGNIEEAIALLDEAIAMQSAPPIQRARCKMELADILLYKDQVWDALLLYGQVDLDFKEDVIGQDAKFKRAMVSYYQGDFSWAKAQFDVLKASTTKRIANNAMEKSLLISDHTALDTTEHPLFLYAQADLLVFQGQYDEATQFLDELNRTYPGHELEDNERWLRYTISMNRGQFETAAQHLEQITANYGYGLLADDAWFQWGSLCETQLNLPQKAMECYEKIIVDFPSSVHIVEARKRYRALRGDEKEQP